MPPLGQLDRPASCRWGQARRLGRCSCTGTRIECAECAAYSTAVLAWLQRDGAVMRGSVICLRTECDADCTEGHHRKEMTATRDSPTAWQNLLLIRSQIAERIDYSLEVGR